MIISNPIPGERLDRFLAKHLTHYSRRTIQQMIVSGSITVNDAVTSKHYILKANDAITVPDLLPQTIQLQVIPNPEVTVTVLRETPDYVVINKPAGLVVHPDAQQRHTATVVNGALARWPEIAAVGDEPTLRPGIVHRLDKDVSGVMVLARTPDMFEHLKKQFQDRTVEKLYVALAHGQFSQLHGVIDFGITRSDRDGSKMAAVPVGQGKPAQTEYTVHTQYQQYTLLDIILHTGRTHQIRVHLNALGHPIVGDAVYRPKRLVTRLRPPRIMLHAQSLSFSDLAGDRITVKAPIPKDMRTVLEGLTLLPA